MSRKMLPREIVDGFASAIREQQIYPCYQPQINHSTGRMVGAEALMRWGHPKYGMQLPADFIPVLEENDLIYAADTYIFECVCRLLRKCLDSGLHPVPVSVNMSRCDMYYHDYVEAIENIRQKYEIPVRYLRIEITETSAIAGLDLLTSIIDRLHGLGYIVEIDDFGSGYSSLNILKDLHVDVIKLDLGFLDGNVGGRGGIILSSVVQMAKWLDTPIISEGVETMEQADYMKSLGCNYIQGYLYSKPIPESEFIEMLRQMKHETERPSMRFLNAINTGKFWAPDSMETLIFNHFVGAAALFTYQENKAEILRVNDKYIWETNIRLTSQDLIHSNPWEFLDDANREKYKDAIRNAIASGDEETVETWRQFHSPGRTKKKNAVCIRSYIQVIGHAERQYLIFARIQNITEEKERFRQLSDSLTRFRYAGEQANMYTWEYIFETREMLPCARSMRDMDIPARLANFPDSIIDSGLIPPDYADMFRVWHHRLAAGEKSLEGVIPLTKWRVPFYIRYTTVFDKKGAPLKAYASATMVLEEEKKKGRPCT